MRDVIEKYDLIELFRLLLLFVVKYCVMAEKEDKSI